ncbi:uncharacterized protein LOC124995215 [Sciurus carolinensis]|uniref:uncharacterized protein LOC124995215 n=1 Tax=Sciurus carolinensis TaxID=30640 RepID=UPI001FB4D367|nr:uncharacterized protein LOC124995215 [Sciurus carolinensis]
MAAGLGATQISVSLARRAPARRPETRPHPRLPRLHPGRARLRLLRTVSQEPRRAPSRRMAADGGGWRRMVPSPQHHRPTYLLPGATEKGNVRPRASLSSGAEPERGPLPGSEHAGMCSCPGAPPLSLRAGARGSGRGLGPRRCLPADRRRARHENCARRGRGVCLEPHTAICTKPRDRHSGPDRGELPLVQDAGSPGSGCAASRTWCFCTQKTGSDRQVANARRPLARALLAAGTSAQPGPRDNGKGAGGPWTLPRGSKRAAVGLDASREGSGEEMASKPPPEIRRTRMRWEVPG